MNARIANDHKPHGMWIGRVSINCMWVGAWWDLEGVYATEMNEKNHEIKQKREDALVDNKNLPGTKEYNQFSSVHLRSKIPKQTKIKIAKKKKQQNFKNLPIYPYTYLSIYPCSHSSIYMTEFFKMLVYQYIKFRSTLIKTT